MIPVALDPKHACLAVAGNGDLALRRLRALRQAGAQNTILFADAPSAELSAAAGAALQPNLPGEKALAGLHALWIAGLDSATGAALAEAARGQRVLVNVEDMPEFCDFHSVAEIRRGDLLLTISTNGAAPGLASSIRRNLETCFPAEWEDRVTEIANLRRGWRADGVPMAEAARRIDAIVEARCWLSCPKPN